MSNELKFERLGDANETYPASTLVVRKQFVYRAIDELKAENERLTIDQRNTELRADVADATVEKLKYENAELKAKADKLHSCLKCLVMRDLIKDCPEKESAIEIVKEFYK